MLRYDRQTKPGLVACTTSGQETERVHSYNPGARTGPDPEGMEGWVGLDGWLHSETVYLPIPIWLRRLDERVIGLPGEQYSGVVVPCVRVVVNVDVVLPATEIAQRRRRVIRYHMTRLQRTTRAVEVGFKN